MTRSHSALRNVAWNHAGKILDFGLLYLARVLIARTLGPANDSLFALFSNLTTVVVLLTAFGSDWVVYRFVPGYAARGERDELAALLRKTYVLRFVASTLCAALFVPMVQNLGWGFGARWGALGPYAVMAGVFIVGQNLTMLGTAAFTAMMNTRVVFAITVSTRLMLAAAIAALAFTGALTAGSAIVMFAIAACISAAAYAVRLRPHATGPDVPLPVRGLATFGAVLLSHDLLYLVLGRQSDILILSYWFPGDAKISIYDNAFQIGLVVEQLVTVGLAGVLFSTYARLAAQNRDALGAAHQRVLQCIQLAYVPVAATAALLAPGVITALYGAQYLPAAQLVQAFLLLDLLDQGLFGGGANIALLNTVGRERTVLMNRIIWGVLNLGINLVVIPRYGVLAAIIVSRGCNLAAVFTENHIVVRTVGGKFSFRTAAVAYGATAAGVAAASFLPRESLVGCIVASIAVICIVTAGYAITKPAALRWALDALRTTIRADRSDAAPFVP